MNFKYLPADYRQIVLTRDISETCENRMRVPYHEFIRMAANADLNVALGEESVKNNSVQQNNKKSGIESMKVFCK